MRYAKTLKAFHNDLMFNFLQTFKCSKNVMVELYILTEGEV